MFSHWVKERERSIGGKEEGKCVKKEHHKFYII